MSTRRGRLARLTTAALAAGVLGVFGLAGPASAATPDVARDGTSSLTVHKYAGAPGAAHNGTELPVEPALPGLNNVTFSAQQVLLNGSPIDLATNAGQALAQALYADLGTSNPTPAQIAGASFSHGTPAVTYTASLGAAATETTSGGTDVQGAVAEFENLDFGLYFVTETAYPAGTTPAAPFLVSVPLTNPAGTGWIYDVHVYPKNSVSTVEKEVDDADDIKLGDEVTFTIRGDIPDGPLGVLDDTTTPVTSGVLIDGYKIVDRLDPKLTYVSADVTMGVPGAQAGTDLVAGTDYTLVTSINAATGGTDVSVELTDAGRLVAGLNPTMQVVVVITTTVNAVGEIANSALLYPNLPSFDIEPGQPGGPGEPEEPVVTKWGGVTLNKTDAATGAVLAGAVFEVWAAAVPADGSAVTFADATRVELPAAAAAGYRYTTGPDGRVVVDGLRWSTWANNAAVAAGAPGYVAYWFVEVTAPAGFELLPEPVPFEVTGLSSVVAVNVVNVPSNSGFQLPLTGGVGTTIFYVAGAFIVVGGLLLAVRSRRAKA